MSFLLPTPVPQNPTTKLTFPIFLRWVDSVARPYPHRRWAPFGRACGIMPFLPSPPPAFTFPPSSVRKRSSTAPTRENGLRSGVDSSTSAQIPHTSRPTVAEYRTRLKNVAVARLPPAYITSVLAKVHQTAGSGLLKIMKCMLNKRFRAMRTQGAAGKPQGHTSPGARVGGVPGPG